MKNIFRISTLILFAMALMLNTACKKEEETKKTDTSSGATYNIPSDMALTDAEGNKIYLARLTSDRTSFTYGENGQLNSYLTSGITFTRSGNNFYNNDSSWVNYLSFNNKGLISKLKITYAFDANYTSSDVYEITYDNDNQMQKIVINRDDYQPYIDMYEVVHVERYVNTDVIVFTWQDGNMISSTHNGEEVAYLDGTQTGSSTYSLTYTYTYSTTPNPFRQITANMSPINTLNPFTLVGLCGKGPKFLPTSYVKTLSEAGQSTTKTYTFDYETNEDGSIATEYWGMQGDAEECIYFTYGRDQK